MWYQDFEIEHQFAKPGGYPLGGVSPMRQDLARHAYLEKRMAHAETDRKHMALPFQEAMPRWVTDAISAFGIAAKHWLLAHL